MHGVFMAGRNEERDVLGNRLGLKKEPVWTSESVRERPGSENDVRVYHRLERMYFPFRFADSVGHFGDGRSKYLCFNAFPLDPRRGPPFIKCLPLLRAMLVCLFKHKSARHKHALFRTGTCGAILGCTLHRAKCRTYKVLEAGEVRNYGCVWTRTSATAYVKLTGLHVAVGILLPGIH